MGMEKRNKMPPITIEVERSTMSSTYIAWRDWLDLLHAEIARTAPINLPCADLPPACAAITTDDLRRQLLSDPDLADDHLDPDDPQPTIAFSREGAFTEQKRSRPTCPRTRTQTTQ